MAIGSREKKRSMARWCRWQSRPGDFSIVLMALRSAGFRGVNVTVPHKEAAFALAHTCDTPARAAGAANLLVFHPDGHIEGRQTAPADADGAAA